MSFAIHPYPSPSRVKSCSYAYFDQQLQGRNKLSRKLQNNTYLERRGENIVIRLHQTDIFSIDQNDTVTVSSGGFKTPTTKARLNDYLPTGFALYACKGLWKWNDDRTFTDGDQLVIEDRKYVLKFQATATSDKAILFLRKEIREYCHGFMQALPVEPPGPGDCLLCCIATKKGERQMGVDHIYSHIKERYYVPRLLWNALEAQGCGDLYKAVCFNFPGHQSTRDSFAKSLHKTAERCLRRYIYRQLGLQT